MFETLTRKAKPKVHDKLKQKDKDSLTCFLCQHYQASASRQYVSETTTLRLCLLDGKYKGATKPLLDSNNNQLLDDEHFPIQARQPTLSLKDIDFTYKKNTR